jgi:hypothetical protein
VKETINQWSVNQCQQSVNVYVISSKFSFAEAVKTTLGLDDVGIYSSIVDALDQIPRCDDTNKPGMVVVDLTSASEADRLIHFLKWSAPTSHVLIVGVGHDSDFTALEPGALGLLDGAVKAPFTRFQLAAAAKAALSVRSEPLKP